MRQSSEMSVSHASGQPTSCPGLDLKTDSYGFRIRPKSRPPGSCQAKPVPVPVTAQDLPGWAKPFISNHPVLVLGFSIYGQIQIYYW